MLPGVAPQPIEVIYSSILLGCPIYLEFHYAKALNPKKSNDSRCGRADILRIIIPL
jgi:hypothetical protein